MPKVLLEDVCGPFVVDRSQGQRGIITENANGLQLFHIPGRFSVCNVKNGNNRRYSRKVWENNLKAGSKLQLMIEKRSAFGLLEHPEDGQINLLSPICHIVTKAELTEKDEVVGELVLVNTAEGQKLKALIEAGYDPFVSSRGFGSLVPAPDGVDEVQEDFVCEGWDVVYNPSFVTAELWPDRKPSVSTESVVNEAAKPQPSQDKAPQPVVESQQKPGASGSPAKPQLRETIMDINSIRGQLQALRGSTSGKVDNNRIVETLGQLDSLHREVESWLHEDTKRSWDAKKLHEDIATEEARLQALQNAPIQEVSKLRQEQTKLLKVTRVVTEQMVGYRTKLGESIKRNGRLKEMVEKTITRGRAYMAKCKGLSEETAKLDFQLDVVSRALDKLVEQSNEEIVKLSSELATLKYGEKITEAQKKALSEATHPKHVLKIVEEIQASIKGAAPQPAPEAKPAPAPENKPPQQESKPAPQPENKPAPVTEAVVNSDPRHALSLEESLAVTRRLSQQEPEKAAALNK